VALSRLDVVDEFPISCSDIHDDSVGRNVPASTQVTANLPPDHRPPGIIGQSGLKILVGSVGGHRELIGPDPGRRLGTNPQVSFCATWIGPENHSRVRDNSGVFRAPVEQRAKPRVDLADGRSTVTGCHVTRLGWASRIPTRSRKSTVGAHPSCFRAFVASPTS
jgi:hypothetical protein